MALTFTNYQHAAHRTAFYGDHISPKFCYAAFGVAGEAGEIIEKVKKIWRDHQGTIDPTDLQALGKEIGDCLWYLAELSTVLGLSLDDLATSNLEKLQDRQRRQQLSGSGDNR